MTVDEFQRRYHYYCVDTKEEALVEIERMEVVEGHLVAAVGFRDLGWCLMLDTAAAVVKEVTDVLS